MWVELSDVFPEELKELIENAPKKEKITYIQENDYVSTLGNSRSTINYSHNVSDYRRCITKHVLVKLSRHSDYRCLRLKTLLRWLGIKTTDKEFDRLLLLYRKNVLKKHIENITGNQDSLFIFVENKEEFIFL